MALDQLGLYNDALLLLGQRALADLTEDREPRRRLDGVYNRAAVEYCLELVQPNFAAQTTTLSSPAAATTFDWSHDKPSDYVTIVQDDDGTGAVYSDAKLDQPINRYVIENDAILADYETIHIRYIRSGTSISDWTPSFFRVVGAFLARELATRLSPDEHDRVDAIFARRVNEANSLERAKVPLKRSSEPTSTLTIPWRRIYNDALLIMGLEEINANNDDSNRRAKLDRALNADLVESLLEDAGWQFGQLSTKIQYDPSAEPAWGFTRAHAKPLDMHRLDGIFQDEYQRVPLKHYKDEGQYWFCDLDAIYVTYVQTDYLTNPSNWPSHFKRLVAARLAKDSAPALRDEGADVENANLEFEQRNLTARNVDAMQSPPQVIHQGDWVGSRWRGDFRGRP